MVLFLDDMQWRHDEFERVAARHGSTVSHVRTAAEAIQALGRNAYEQVFLDHDLSTEDIMSVVGQPTVAPTGMMVVDHIIGMASPPQDVIVHSCNGPAREEMVRKLEESGRIKRVRGIDFVSLMSRLH